MKTRPEKNKTNKHILKYDQNESDLFFVRLTDDGVLTIVLNQALRDNKSPEEVKQLSRNFADQVQLLLEAEGHEGLRKLTEMPPPATVAIKNPNFSLS